MSLDDSWFSEAFADSGSAFSLKLRRKLHDEQTAFQHIEIYATASYGNLMVFDGCVMLTSLDNFIYHEMMSHPALFSHRDPRDVLIIGGGDCGTLREVLKHKNVQRCVQVDIDERVTRVSEEFFPELCESNKDPRTQLLFEDGIKYAAEGDARSFDIIIIDSTDPVGQAARLFSTEFYQDCHRLLRDGGILVAQSESPLVHIDLINSMRSNMRQAGFDSRATLQFPQSCYPTGWWSCTLAGKHCELESFREPGSSSLPTRYYNPGIHRGALASPEFMLEQLDT